MIFDSHAHLISADQISYPPNPLTGKLSPGEFEDPMTVEKLIANMDAQGVVRACAVQRAHVYGYDNLYILASCARFPEKLRAVVVLNPIAPDTPRQLRSLFDEFGIAGVRFGAPKFPEAPTDWLSSDEAVASWKCAIDLGIPICVHVLHVQRDTVLPVLYDMMKRLPEARIVVDHVGGAHASVVETRWLASQNRTAGPEIIEDALRLADHDGVTMKFSDINLENSNDGAAFVGHVVSRFGKERVIWGSDIGQSRGEYGHMVALAKGAVAGMDAAAQHAILYDNALRLYG